MEFFNPFTQSRQEKSLSATKVTPTCATPEPGAISPRRRTDGTNFSYPRLSRHESRESQSSDDSVPGMTDSSDSDVDDDTWDNFWPDRVTSLTRRKSHEQEQELNLLLQPGRCKDYAKIDIAKRRQAVDLGSDGIRILCHEYDRSEMITPCPGSRSPSSQYSPAQDSSPKSPRSPAPEPTAANTQDASHPPRTSSLSFGPLSPPPPPSLLLRNSRSSTALKSKSTQVSNYNFIAPSLAFYGKKTSSSTSSSPAKQTRSAPVSPVYPPPPPPKTLRPVSSAINLRDKMASPSTTRQQQQGHLVSHNVTAPLAPLLPSALPEAPPRRPQPEHCISVFEYDSDSDSESDTDEGYSGFARRIARGLHRKSNPTTTSEKEKRVGVFFERKKSDASELEEEGARRKRGGSLGRIFGFRSRKIPMSP